MIQSLNHFSQCLYRQYAAVSQSDLKRCYENPQLYHQVRTGRVKPTDSSDAQEWGTMCETYIRTGLIAAVRIPPELLRVDGGRNGSSKDYKEFCKQNYGKVMVTDREWFKLLDQFKQVIENIQGHELARTLIYNSCATWGQKFEFEEPASKLGMKCELDIFDEQNQLIVDLKTADDVTPRAIMQAVIKYGYDIQAAAYLAAARLWCPEGEWSYSWVFVRNKPPFNVEVAEASSELLEFGRQRLLDRIGVYQECEATGQWVTPTHGTPIMVYPPRWAQEWSV